MSNSSEIEQDFSSKIGYVELETLCCAVEVFDPRESSFYHDVQSYDSKTHTLSVEYDFEGKCDSNVSPYKFWEHIETNTN